MLGSPLRSALLVGPALVAGGVIALLCPSAAPVGAADAKLSPAEAGKFYDEQVRPILEAHCGSCHGAEKKVKGGLRMTTREGLLKGGHNGPAISLEKPDASLFLDAIHHRNNLKMPPRGKLPQAHLDTLTRWVRAGAPFAEKSAAAGHDTKHGPPPVDERAKNFWSFKAPVRPAVPAVKAAGWVRNPVDAFILAKLEAAGFAPAPPVEKTALLRRVYYTLTGLPPSPAEVEAFLADGSPDAYEKVVDRLLASRHYGEQQARRWLDLVRFAETNSFERDGPKPHAWKYRDYVIRSFHTDKPYDRFLVEQLAGDEIEPVTRDGIIATGYYRLGLWDDEPVDRELAYYDQLDDIVSTTSQTMLGLTVGCARCHDHKIDPIPQKDYYRLLAFFHGVNAYGNGPLAVRSIGDPKSVPPPPARGKEDPKEARKKADAEAARAADYERRLADLNGKIAVIEEALAVRLTGGERDDFRYEENRAHIVARHTGGLIAKADAERYAALRAQREELRKNRPAVLEQALAVLERGNTARETYILARGMPAAKGEKVEPGFPTVITDASPKLPVMPAGSRTAGRRRVAAEWIADAKNPLTARVMVNRLFQYAFGRGIVRSTSNFGYMGTPPTHPELLDWLATEFVGKGWSVKAILRLLVTSNAFRMSGATTPEAEARDPENDLVRRFELRRLTAEEIRDTVLAVSGNLNTAKTEGPSVYPTIPPEVLAGQSIPGNGWGRSTPEEQAARSVFVYVKRSLAVPQLAVFDVPDPDAPCAVRFTTTQPTQALIMINGKFMNDQAGLFAASLVKAGATEPAAQIALALRRATQRTPTASEVQRGVKFLADMQEKEKLPAGEALRRFCLLALNLNEMVYVD
jgi:cytochrome c553